jgi:hypothetical protein
MGTRFPHDIGDPSDSAELSSIVERLERVIRPTHIPAWLNEPLDLLDGDKPIERIAPGDSGTDRDP